MSFYFGIVYLITVKVMIRYNPDDVEVQIFSCCFNFCKQSKSWRSQIFLASDFMKSTVAPLQHVLIEFLFIVFQDRTAAAPTHWIQLFWYTSSYQGTESANTVCASFCVRYSLHGRSFRLFYPDSRLPIRLDYWGGSYNNLNIFLPCVVFSERSGLPGQGVETLDDK